MEERRKLERYSVALTARYVIDHERRGDCEIVEINEEGTKIKFYAKEKIEIGTRIQLSIDMPLKDGPMPAVINARWIRELEGDMDYNFLAGGILILVISAEKDLLKKYILGQVEKGVDGALKKGVE